MQKDRSECQKRLAAAISAAAKAEIREAGFEMVLVMDYQWEALDAAFQRALDQLFPAVAQTLDGLEVIYPHHARAAAVPSAP